MDKQLRACLMIKEFAKQFGRPHLHLAYHAALPLVLTPDLLYAIWANFQRDTKGQYLNIPWIAVADLLLSPLCREIRYETFAMNAAVRNLLLPKLRKGRFSSTQGNRLIELAEFLRQYIQPELELTKPSYVREQAQAQQWATWAYTRPEEMIKGLAQAFQSSDPQLLEHVRLAELVQTFAEPVSSWVKPAPEVQVDMDTLLAYARGVVSLAQDDPDAARASLKPIAAPDEPVVRVAGIRMPVPVEILLPSEESVEPVAGPVKGTQQAAQQLDEIRSSTVTEELVHLIVTIEEDPVDSHKLRWLFASAYWPAADLPAGSSPNLGAQEFVKTYLAPFGMPGHWSNPHMDDQGRLKPRSIPTLLGNLIQLRKHAPPQFWTAYQQVLQTHQAQGHSPETLTLLFRTSDTHIPWELMPISEEVEEDKIPLLLGNAHRVGRWLIALETPMPEINLNLRGFALVAPIYVQHPLPEAQEERHFIEQRYHPYPIIETPEQFRTFMLDGQPTGGTGILHFTGHGDCCTDEIRGNWLVLSDADDGDWYDIHAASNDLGNRLGKLRPTLAFFNTTNVGRTAPGPVGSNGGWGRALLQQQYKGYIGPLWGIHDKHARDVAQTFYTLAIDSGLPLGEVMRQIRAKFAEDNRLFTYLAYLYLGHPLAKITYTPFDEVLDQEKRIPSPVQTELQKDGYYIYRIRVANHNQVWVEKITPTRELLGEPRGVFGYKGALRQEIDARVQMAQTGKLQGSEVKALGEALFKTLFDNNLRQDFVHLYEQTVHKENKRLRIELDIDEVQLPEVAALPWEFMCLSTETNLGSLWLGADPRLILSRRRIQWHTPLPIELKEGERLRLALVIAAPEDLEPIEYRKIEEDLQKLVKQEEDRIELLPIVEQANVEAIDQILGLKPHLFHFIGHGRLKQGQDKPVGQIALVDDFNEAMWVDENYFSDLFLRYLPGVVVLQACEGGQLSASQAFTTVASRLVQQNIPVVVAMQYVVSNSTASRFARRFYQRLAQGEPVDRATQEARYGIALGPEEFQSRDFATPVIYTRLQEGRLFVRQPAPVLIKTSADARSREKSVYQALLKLNYLEQKKLFRELLSHNYKSAAILIHGPRGYGQKLLLNMLIKQVSSISAQELTQINMNLGTDGIRPLDVNGLWFQLASYFTLNPDLRSTEIAEKISESLQVQNVILIFDNIAIIDPQVITMVRDFWQELLSHVDLIKQKNWLLLFLVDNEGESGDWLKDLTDNMSSNWHPSQLIKLPSLTPFTRQDLEYWLASEDLLNQKFSTHSALPQKILEHSQNGVPELVFRYVCELYGIEYVQVIEPLVR